MAYKNMESLLLRSLKSEDISAEMEFVEANYKDDVDVYILNAQLSIFRILLKSSLFL